MMHKGVSYTCIIANSAPSVLHVSAFIVVSLSVCVFPLQHQRMTCIRQIELTSQVFTEKLSFQRYSLFSPSQGQGKPFSIIEVSTWQVQLTTITYERYEQVNGRQRKRCMYTVQCNVYAWANSAPCILHSSAFITLWKTFYTYCGFFIWRFPEYRICSIGRRSYYLFHGQSLRGYCLRAAFILLQPRWPLPLFDFCTRHARMCYRLHTRRGQYSRARTIPFSIAGGAATIRQR